MSSSSGNQAPLPPPNYPPGVPPNFNFYDDNEGKFDDKKCEGPALLLPADLKTIPLEATWTVEPLYIAAAKKNHIISRVSFREPIEWKKSNKTYLGAILSMEDTDGREYRDGDDVFKPGRLNIKLTPHKKSRRAHGRSWGFTFKGLETLGTLVETILGHRMNCFFFTGHAGNPQWMGCGDWIIQVWAQLVHFRRLNKYPNGSELLLSAILGVTYKPDGSTEDRLVGKGHWAYFKRIVDDDAGLVPSTTYE